MGAGLYEVLRRRSAITRRAEAEDQSAQIVQSAQREAENLVKEAKLESKDLVFQARIELEKEQKAKLAEVSNVERRVSQREEGLDRKVPKTPDVPTAVTDAAPLAPSAAGDSPWLPFSAQSSPTA